MWPCVVAPGPEYLRFWPWCNIPTETLPFPHPLRPRKAASYLVLMRVPYDVRLASRSSFARFICLHRRSHLMDQHVLEWLRRIDDNSTTHAESVGQVHVVVSSSSGVGGASFALNLLGWCSCYIVAASVPYCCGLRRRRPKGGLIPLLDHSVRQDVFPRRFSTTRS